MKNVILNTVIHLESGRKFKCIEISSNDLYGLVEVEEIPDPKNDKLKTYLPIGEKFERDKNSLQQLFDSSMVKKTTVDIYENFFRDSK